MWHIIQISKDKTGQNTQTQRNQYQWKSKEWPPQKPPAPKKNALHCSTSSSNVVRLLHPQGLPGGAARLQDGDSRLSQCCTTSQSQKPPQQPGSFWLLIGDFQGNKKKRAAYWVTPLKCKAWLAWWKTMENTCISALAPPRDKRLQNPGCLIWFLSFRNMLTWWHLPSGPRISCPKSCAIDVDIHIWYICMYDERACTYIALCVIIHTWWRFQFVAPLLRNCTTSWGLVGPEDVLKPSMECRTTAGECMQPTLPTISVSLSLSPFFTTEKTYQPMQTYHKINKSKQREQYHKPS